jgi:malate dehydrogenase (quinone)
MTKVGIEEYPLVEYLAGQLMLSDDDRFEALRILPERQEGRLAPVAGRPARADHQA